VASTIVDLVYVSTRQYLEGSLEKMRIERRGYLIAYIAAVITFSGIGTHAVFGQLTENRVAPVDDRACTSLIQEDVVSAKLPPVTGRQIHLSIEGHQALLLLPNQKEPRRELDWVWFAPMVSTQPNKHHAFIIQHVLDAGMAFAAVNVGESYGNPEGTRIYDEFHDVLHRCFHLSQKAVLLPQSRGGLMLFNWATLHPDEIARIVGIYPVCDLRSYPGMKIAAPAYGMTEQQLESNLVHYNPIDLLASLAKANVPIFVIHGDSDKIVPLKDNSDVLVRRYQDLGGTANLFIVPGKGHEEVPEFFESQRFVDFLTTGKTASRE
jgi:predicted esterase